MLRGHCRTGQQAQICHALIPLPCHYLCCQCASAVTTLTSCLTTKIGSIRLISVIPYCAQKYDSAQEATGRVSEKERNVTSNKLLKPLLQDMGMREQHAWLAKQPATGTDACSQVNSHHIQGHPSCLHEPTPPIRCRVERLLGYGGMAKKLRLPILLAIMPQQLKESAKLHLLRPLPAHVYSSLLHCSSFAGKQFHICNACHMSCMHACMS